MSQQDATDLTFALSATAEPLPEDDDRPCAYCNSDERVHERRYCIVEENPDVDSLDDLPDDVGLVFAEYILRFGHAEGAGVEVPICDMCLCDVPVEFDGQTTRSEMDYRYYGSGNVRRHVVEDDDGHEVHRYVPVEGE